MVAAVCAPVGIRRHFLAGGWDCGGMPRNEIKGLSLPLLSVSDNIWQYLMPCCRNVAAITIKVATYSLQNIHMYCSWIKGVMRPRSKSGHPNLSISGGSGRGWKEVFVLILASASPVWVLHPVCREHLFPKAVIRSFAFAFALSHWICIFLISWGE